MKALIYNSLTLNRRPRKLFKLGMLALALLLGGAIVNVAVAMWCSFHVDPNVFASFNWPSTVRLIHQERESSSDEEIKASIAAMHHRERQRLQRLGWIPRGEFQPRMKRTDIDRRLTAATLSTFGLRTRKVWENEFLGDIGHIREVRHQVWSGWPLVSLYGESNVVGSTNVIGSAVSRWNDRWLLRRALQTDPTARLVPLHPTFPGFAVNAALYGMLLGVLCLAPGETRRYIRRRRGLCPACAYDLRGSTSPVCTECGAAVKQSAISGQQSA